MSTNQRNPTWGERFDDFIGLFAPQMALERKRSRLLLRATSSAYEDVPTWRNSAGWNPADGSAEGLNGPSRELARAKARHLERNSEIVNSILNALTRNVVGKGFNLQVRTDNKEWNNLLEVVWQEWCRAGNCDVTGNYSFNDILRMIVRRKTVDGGILLVKVYDSSSNIPYRLQVVEVDELQSPSIQSKAGNPIVGGIEVNAYGKKLAYYIKQTSPDGLTLLDPERIPAKRVIYLAEHSRPSEVREISPFVRTLNEIKDLEEFFDAAGFKQKITAALAVFITTEKNAGPVVGSSVVGNAGKVPKGERINPGSIKYLGEGQDVKTLVPSGQSSELADFNLAVVRRIAAGHGLSYEMVSRDVSQVNYSSARQNLLEDWKTIEQEQQYIVEHLLDFVFEEVVKSAIMGGRISLKEVPAGFYENPSKFLKHEFIGQGLPWIDPYKEALANKIMLETGQSNLKEIYAKKGKDYEGEIDQIIIEYALKKMAGLIEEPQKGDGKNAQTND